jgi:hypothetical protein
LVIPSPPPEGEGKLILALSVTRLKRGAEEPALKLNIEQYIKAMENFAVLFVNLITFGIKQS